MSLWILDLWYQKLLVLAAVIKAHRHPSPSGLLKEPSDLLPEAISYLSPFYVVDDTTLRRFAHLRKARMLRPPILRRTHAIAQILELQAIQLRCPKSDVNFLEPPFPGFQYVILDKDHQASAAK